MTIFSINLCYTFRSFEEPEFTQTEYWRYLDLEILDSKSSIDSAVKTAADQANQPKSLEHLEQEQVSPAVSFKIPSLLQ
jgi:hypothetical protein